MGSLPIAQRNVTRRTALVGAIVAAAAALTACSAGVPSTPTTGAAATTAPPTIAAATAATSGQVTAVGTAKPATTGSPAAGATNATTGATTGSVVAGSAATPASAMPAATASKGTLVIAIDADPANLEPGTNLATPTGSEIIVNVFDTLVAWKAPDFTQLEGRLAESWTTSADGAAYTFKLRPNIKFHDGTAFDANAVKVTFERTKKINSFMQAYFGPISGVTATDPQTVVITLSQPSSVFLSWLAMPQAAVVSPAAVDKFGAMFNVNPVGTGPFIFDSYTPNTQVALKANPGYWRGAPKLQGIVYRIIPNAATRRLELEQGSVDLIQQNSQLSAIPAEDVKALKANPAIDVLDVKSQIIRNLDFNNNKADSPVADIRVRQALSYAVDYDALVGSLWGGTASRVYGPLTSSSWGFDQSVKDKAFSRDVNKAKMLLAAAGYGSSKPLKMTMPTYQGSSWRDVSTFLQANFADVGVQIDIQQPDFAVFRQQHTSGNFDIALDGRQPWYNDPDAHIGIGYLSSLAGTALNFRMPPDAKLDGMIQQAQTAQDQAARKKLYVDIQLALLDKVPGVYLFSPDLIIFKRKGIDGLLVNSAPPLTEYWSVSKAS